MGQNFSWPEQIGHRLDQQGDDDNERETVEGTAFMGKNYSDNLDSIKNTGENLTLKQMFEIFE